MTRIRRKGKPGQSRGKVAAREQLASSTIARTALAHAMDATALLLVLDRDLEPLQHGSGARWLRNHVRRVLSQTTSASRALEAAMAAGVGGRAAAA